MATLVVWLPFAEETGSAESPLSSKLGLLRVHVTACSGSISILLEKDSYHCSGARL